MKKRLIGTLLMGALFVSSTSVFVSCKDYDDDINSVSSRVTTLEAAKADLEAKISQLRSDLEANYATKAALAAAEQTASQATANEKARAEAAELALTQKLTTAQGALDELNNLIGGNLEGYATYKEAITAIWTKIESVETGLGARLSKLETDLSLDNPESALRVYLKQIEDQVAVLDGYTTVLNAWKAALDADGGAASKNYADAKANEAQTNATTAANGYTDTKTAEAKAYADAKLTEAKTYADGLLTQAKSYTDDQIAALNIQQLRDNVNTLSSKVDALQAELNTLAWAVRQLKSLVFIPKGYIDGVEATEILSLQYWKFYNRPGDILQNWTTFGNPWDANAGWNIKENKYDEVGFDKTETDKNRETDHQRYYSKNYELFERVLDFTANYHLNPSSADLTNITKDNVKPISDDKWFKTTRSATAGNNACAGFFVRDIVKPADGGGEAGILKVQYGLDDASKIKEGNEITVFATQVNYGDTTITSDYATLINTHVKNLVLSHAPRANATSLIIDGAYTPGKKAKVRNTHCGYCALADGATTNENAERDHLHLFATLTEAAGTGADVKDKTAGFDPQDAVAYNNREGVNLAQLVETHYDDVRDGKHYNLADISQYGLHYQFELTYLRYGGNLTSESAHAVIVFKKDGAVVEEGTEGATPYLIPWLPTDESREGKQSAYDATKAEQYQTKQLVGRTPIVRVSLVDNDGSVLDYGYIRFLIVDNDPAIQPSAYRTFVAFTGDDWTGSTATPWCGNTTTTAPNYSYTTKWIETELQIYTVAGMSHADFLKNYKAELKTGTTTNECVIYVPGGINSENEKQRSFSPATTDMGTIREVPNLEDEETNVLTWAVSGTTLKNAAQAGQTQYSVAMRYMYVAGDQTRTTSAEESKDIYVVLNTGTLTLTDSQGSKPYGTINWDNRKNANYWYDKDNYGERSGLVEVHANVYAVEDELEAQAITFKQTLQAAFVGNEIVKLNSLADKKAFLNLQNATDEMYNNLNLSLKFVIGTNNKFNGYLNGRLYQFCGEIADDGKTLNVWRDDDKDGEHDITEPSQTVAKLVYSDPGNQDINHMDVVYQHTDFAEALLNYKSKEDLADDVLTAYISVFAKYQACDIELTGDPINVRFLRPINVENKNAVVRDASTNDGQQKIYLRDLVNLSDWRRLSKNDFNWKTNYWYYYNIKSIEVIGVNDGGNLTENEDILTNMNQAVDSDPATTLKQVSSLVKFTYYKNTPTLTPNAMPLEGDYGYILYQNLGSNVQKFRVQIPIKVIYEWGGVHTANAEGAIFTTVTVDIEKTEGTARKY